jgi:hypothetical protein
VKKTYATPHLVVHGTVEELTLRNKRPRRRKRRRGGVDPIVDPTS